MSIAFMSQQLQHKLDHFAEALLNPLIILIPNSAKVIFAAEIKTSTPLRCYLINMFEFNYSIDHGNCRYCCDPLHHRAHA